ncbi:MAG TPA: TonB-dependent receptor [Mucilaginibacter sp.]|nr:TonB-dependent receptor [Mucilaginibacter sp.]
MKKLLLVSLCFLVLCVTQVFAQNRTVTGTVTAKDDGLPIPGVTVKIKGTGVGTPTDVNGKYSISVPAGATLQFSFISFLSQDIPVNGRNVIDVVLAPNTKELNEVVVVGYQTIQRKDAVGSLSVVDAKKFEEKPIVSFLQDLQGTAPGVQVTGSSGRPGNNAVIRIRGTGSITASSDPLIVVDGIQVATVAYAELNPDDIDNVTILKDASAVAIYGSRGSNGVILVTTKSGKANAPSLHYSFRYGKTQRQDFKNVTLMSSAQKLQYEYDAKYLDPTLDTMLINRGLPEDLSAITDAQRQTLWNLAISRGAGDWSKYLFQNATTRTHSISLSGGADKISYFLSGDINDNAGVERYSGFNRKGGRLNVTYQALPWFKMGTNIGVTTSHDNRVREAYNSQNSYAALFFFNPYEQPYNNDGTFNTTAQGFSPLEGAVNNPVSYDIVSDFGTFFAEANFFKHLTIKSQYAINYNTQNYQSYLQPGSNLAIILGYNQKQDQIQQNFFYSFTNTANWNQTVGGHHTFNALLGTEYDKGNLYTLSATGRGFPSKDFTTLENAATPTQASTSITQFSLISYFGALNYDYDKRYFINITGRRDGSSRFGANVQFANFGAIGAAWDLKNEKFLSLPNWISDLKLRGSFGTSGNNNITDYQALATYQTSKYNDQTAIIPSKLANPNLTWETSHSQDGGITYGFLDSRITGELDYYNRVNSNLLYPVNVSATTGFASYTGNVGAVRNRGVEFSINGSVVRTKDLKWDLNFMYSHNDNVVTQLYSNNAVGINASGIQRLVQGEPINVYYLVKEQGVNPADGKEVYYNLDGSTTETYVGSQAAILHNKSANVKHFGSFGTTLNYKGLDFSASFYYSGGNWIYNQIWMDETSSSSVNGNLFTEAANYWKKPGDVVPYPRVLDPATGKPDGTQATENYTTKYLEKGDYVELRDVTLGYTIPTRITKKYHVQSIRVFAQGTNLLMWTKYHGNPEFAEAGETASFAGSLALYGYPPIKGYTFGVDVRF